VSTAPLSPREPTKRPAPPLHEVRRLLARYKRVAGTPARRPKRKRQA
jgi:hypothetical protein